MKSKELLKAAPTLSKLMGVTPDLVRAHIKYKVGDIGKYCFMMTPAGKKKSQYYIMRADVPKVLHRELTPEEEDWV